MMACSTQGTLTAYSVVASRTIYSGSTRGRVTCFGCCTQSAKFYEDRGNKKAKSLKSALNSAGSCLALHKYRGVTPRSTDVQLVPDESGARFSRSLIQQPVSTFSTKRVLTCPHMSDLENGQSEMLPSFRAVQFQNLIPLASVSAEDGVDLCIP